MIDENRKGMRAVKRKIKPTSGHPGTKKLGPATPMTRKIHVAKNGVFKVKKHKYFEDLEEQLTNTLNEYQDRMAGVGMGDYGQRENTNGGGEYNDEVGMIKSDLHTIVRSSVDLGKALQPGENLPEWAQEKIAQAKGMIVAVSDYMLSQHDQGEVFQTNESNGEHVSVLYIDGRPSTKYTNPKDAEKDLNTLKSKYPKKSFELKREIREDDDLEEGWGKAALIGTAAFIAAIAGINHMQAQKLMHSDPQLAKLAQFRDRAVKMGDEDKVHELDDRIKVTLDHLQVTGDEIRGDDGRPVDPVYEERKMDDRLRAAQQNLISLRRGENRKKTVDVKSSERSPQPKKSKDDPTVGSIKKAPAVIASGGGTPNPEIEKMLADFLAKGGEIKKGRPGKAPPVGRNQASLHIGGAGNYKRKGDKPGLGAKYLGDKDVAVEGWTHDSLAKKLFEQEITYEDQLNGMLRRKLSK